jgi:hypothetical protein
MTDTSPAAELRAAAEKIRVSVDAVRSPDGIDNSWIAEGLIVSQGVYPDGSPVYPVADAATPQCAAYIASMGPDVGAVLADWLERAGDHVRLQALCCDNGEHQCSDIAAPLSPSPARSSGASDDRPPGGSRSAAADGPQG